MSLLKVMQRSVPRILGYASENLAVKYLEKQGLIVIDRNYSCRFGEIDVIAMDKEILVFIEVKARINEHTMSIRQTLSYSKQKKIIQTARHYLSQHPNNIDRQLRFDFIGINTSHTPNTVDWLQSAFSANER